MFEIEDLVASTQDIEINGKSIPIRGLNIQEIATLIKDNFSDLSSIFTLFKDKKFAELIELFPSFIVSIVTVVLNAKGKEDIIKNIAAIDQLLIFTTTFQLTFSDEKKTSYLMDYLTKMTVQLVTSMQGESVLNQEGAKSQVVKSKQQMKK